MADRVQYVMDKMASMFRQIGKLEVLSKSELTSVVKKRTDFEYTLRRREMTSDLFYSYLQYEINLDKLLSIRCDQLVEDGTNGKDNIINIIRMIQIASIKHICYIFDRAIRRFPSEIELWNDYIAFLVSKKANRILGATFGKAVALHPKVESFWIQAASFELEHNQNIHAARALLQRALRYCNQSHKLWSQYFDLELWSAVRALERQRILGLEVDTAVLSGAPAVVFKHAIRNVPDVVFACTLHEAALRMMGCVANELECLMEKEYGSDAYLREYLIRVRVQLSLEASADGNIDSEKALTICSNAVDKCLDSLRQLDENVIELGDRDSIMCGVLCSTLSSVSEFLATQTLPESFDPSSDEDRVGKKRRVINTNESAVCLLVANLMNVSELLLAIQLRAHADGTQLVAESRCIEGRIKVRMLLESLGHPFACSKTLTLRELNEWIRSSGSSLRRLQSSATGKSAPSGNSVSSQSSPLTAWIETIELSRRMLTELLQLCLIEGCEQPTKKKAHTSNASTDRLDVNNTADLLKLLLEHADLLVTSEMGANTVKHTLDLLLSLRGFDFVEDSIKQLVLLKHFPGNGAFTRVHFMTELAKQSASNENSLGNSRFQKTVAWLLKQVDQRPSLFFDTNLTSFYEYILQYILFILHPSKDSSMNSRDTRTFAVTIAERAVAKYHDNRHLWQAFQDIERVCGHNDKAQHLLWRSKV